MTKCAKCQAENREEAGFCKECGNKLELACPRCGNMNPHASKFCDGCGHNLAIASASPILKPLSFDEKLQKIQKYLPGDLTVKILAQRGKIEGERRQVTVMFCDLKSFTPLSEKLGEERMYTLVDELFEMMIHKVHEYGGTVNKGTGDGIMALFGAPIALEDAPQRAIRSALAIQHEMAKFSGTLKEESGAPTLKMRIGIHTGPVVVGTIGNDLRVEFTAVGDTVNLASRMEGLAEPGTACVSGDTFKLTEGFFRFEALGERQVKGKEAPVKAYRVIALSSSRTRFDVSAELGLTPFVGRQKELELLLDGFERARSGKGQAFSITGEAGVGKSRLLYEFRKAVANEDATLLEGKCLSYSQNVAYHPVIDLLRSNFDIREGDDDSRVSDKVKSGLKQIGLDDVSTLPYLLELLGVNDSGIDKIPISPEGKKDRMLEAVKRIILKASEARPLIMAVEDLHWTDRSSEEALKYLLEGIPGSRILLIFTYRPEFVHTWGSRSYHSQVTINRLSNRESLAMLTCLLGTEKTEAPLQELVLQKTEGIPFFIEEFIRSLKDLKLIERKNGAYHLTRDIHDVAIPGTIQDVIMARVDSLPEAARGVLQAGSAIEREFGHELIKRVLGIPEQELLSHLSALKDSELLYERGIYPNSTYIFRHALTREVVYNSILASRRKRLHLEIANAIEDVYKDSLDEHYEALAEHYVAGDGYEKGADYCRLLARKYVKAAALNNAVAYAEKRVACLERLPRTADVEKQIIDARTALGMYYHQMVFIVEAKEAVAPVLELALKGDNKRRVSQIYTIMGAYYHSVKEDFPAALKYLREAIKIADEIGDALSIWASNHWIGHALADNCEFEEALAHIERSLQINMATNVLWGISVMKNCIADTVYNKWGKADLAYHVSSEGMQLAEKSGDIFSQADAYSNYGIACWVKGFLDEAEACLLKGLGLTTKINYPLGSMRASQFLGEIYFVRAEYQKAQEYYEKALLVSERLGVWPSGASYYRVILASVKVMNKEKDIDLESLYVYANENKLKYIEGPLSMRIAEILLNIDDRHMPAAEAWVRKAIEADTRNRTMMYLGWDYAFYAELLKRKGDLAGAKEKLGKAIEIYRECGADGWLKKAREDLAELQKTG